MIHICIHMAEASSKQGVQEGYNAIAGAFHRSRSGEWLDFVWIKGLLAAGSKVLDLGCGNGRLLGFLTEYQDISYTGIDTNTFFIQEAGRRYADRGSHARFFTGSMQEVGAVLSGEQGNFDMICVVASFHHLASAGERMAALRQMYELLKPGGCVVMLNWNLWRLSLKKKSVWRYAWMYLTDKSYREKIRGSKVGGRYALNEVFTEWRREQQEGVLYYHAFSARELDVLLKKAGFTSVESFYSLKGLRVDWSKGENIVSIARKL